MLDPKRGDFTDTVISYDFINQRLRYLATITVFHNSSKPATEHAEEIFNYSEVQIEMDGVLIFVFLTLILLGYPSGLCMCCVAWQSLAKTCTLLVLGS